MKKRFGMFVVALGLTLVPIFAGADDVAELAVPIQTGDTIAFLGNSITAAGIYCRLVAHGLKTQNIFTELVVAGVPGNTSKHMLDRLDSVLKSKPQLLVLAAGVNDIWHGDPTVKIGVFQPSPGMGVTLEDYKINITEITAIPQGLRFRARARARARRYAVDALRMSGMSIETIRRGSSRPASKWVRSASARRRQTSKTAAHSVAERLAMR